MPNTPEIIPCSELFVEPPSELMSLIVRSYTNVDVAGMHGPDERLTHVIGLRNTAGALAAAVVLEQTRVMVVATDPLVSNRFSLGCDLLEVVYDEGVAAWISIGERYQKAQSLVESAGMQRINDPDTLAFLFDSLGRPKDYRVNVDEAGLLVTVNGPTSSRPGNRQQIWGWKDRISTIDKAPLRTQ